MGNQFNEYKVPVLSLKSFFALGGIPIPNSSTRTPKNLATLKCPSSWINTINVNIKSATIIPSMIICSYKWKITNDSLSKFLFL